MNNRLIEKLFFYLLLTLFVNCNTPFLKKIEENQLDPSNKLIPTNICDHEWLWYQTDNCIAGLQYIRVNINPNTTSFDPTKTNQQNLEEIEKSFMIAMNAYIAVLISAKRDVERSSLKRINLTILGILSTVTATVLATASPANSAIVAGLGAFSTGIITYQGVLGEEGVSRVALNRVYTKLQERQESLFTEFRKHSVIAASIPEGPDKLKFLDSYTNIKLIIYELSCFAYKVPSMPTEKEIEKIREQSLNTRKEIEKEFKDLQERMDAARRNSRTLSLEEIENFKKKTQAILSGIN